MAVPASFVACPNLQDALVSQFTKFDPVMTQDQLGYSLFLNSDMNTSGVLQRQISGGGKTRKVELRYQPRPLEADVTDSAIQSCAGGLEEGDLVTVYDLDVTDGKSVQWTVTNANLVAKCDENPAWFAQQVARYMNVLHRAINRDLLDSAALNFGNFASTSFDHITGAASLWAGATGPAEAPTRVSGGNAYDPRFITQVRSEFQKLNYSGTPIVIGDNLVDAFFTEFDAACCSDNGLDLAELARVKPIIYMRDEQVEAQVGVNEFIAMAPGAVQLLTFNEFEGEGNIFADDTYTQGTLVHPGSGFVYDYISKFDCGVWKNQLKLAYKPIYLPSNIYQATDKMSGANWLQNFKVVNP